VAGETRRIQHCDGPPSGEGCLYWRICELWRFAFCDRCKILVCHRRRGGAVSLRNLILETGIIWRDQSAFACGNRESLAAAETPRDFFYVGRLLVYFLLHCNRAGARLPDD